MYLCGIRGMQCLLVYYVSIVNYFDFIFIRVLICINPAHLCFDTCVKTVIAIHGISTLRSCEL